MLGIFLLTGYISLYHLSNNSVQVGVTHRKVLITTGQCLLKLSQKFIDKVGILCLTIYYKGLNYLIIVTYSNKLLGKVL